MARRRHQQGTVDYRGKQGVGSVRHWETVLLPDGTFQRKKLRTPIGKTKGKGKMLKTQVAEIATDIIRLTNKRESRPLALMSFGDYWAGQYQLQLDTTSDNFQATMRSVMTLHVLPSLGKLSFRQITKDHIRLLLNLKKAQVAPATVRAIRNYIAMVYSDATKNGVIDTISPTKFVKPPELVQVRPHTALHAPQAAYCVTRLKMPFDIMALLSCCLSLGPAELTAIHWRSMNLTDADVLLPGDYLPPRSVQIMANWTRGKLKGPKTSARGRILPLPDLAIPMLNEWRRQSKFVTNADFVFAAQFSKTGAPVNADDASKYHLKHLSEDLDVKVTWYSFRHTFAFLFERLRGTAFEKKCLMGHSRNADITDRYTSTTFERLREIVNGIAGLIAVELTKTEAPQKVVMIR